MKSSLKWKYTVIAGLLFVLCAILAPLPALAAPAPDNYLTGNSEFVRKVTNVLNSYGDILLSAARSLFLGLATLSLAFGLYKSILSGESNLGSVAAHLTKWIIYVGLFMWIMSSMDYVFFIPKIIVNSFAKLGASIGTLDKVSPDGILETGVGFYALFVQKCASIFGWTELGTWLIVGILGLMVLVALYILAGIMVVALIEIHLVICGGAVLLGFAGFEYTRDVAFSYIKYSISAGVKILTIMIVYGVATEIMMDWKDTIQSVADSERLLSFATTALGSAFTIVMAAKMVPSIAQSMVNGAVSHHGAELMTTTALAGIQGLKQAGSIVKDVVTNARRAQTAAFRGMASTVDAVKADGLAGGAAYVAASTPGVRNFVNAAQNGGVRNALGYVAASVLYGSQSDRALRRLANDQPEMGPGNAPAENPAPGSPEALIARLKRG